MTTRPFEDVRSPSRWTRGFLAAMGLLLLVGMDQSLHALRIPVVYLMTERTSLGMTVGLATAAVFLAAVSPRPWRTRVLLSISILAYPVVLGKAAALVAAYAILVAGLSRCRLRLGVQVALALALWAVIPVCRWVLPKAASTTLPMSLMMVWAAMAYSAIYVLVERSRRVDKPTLVEDVFYLVALPRLLCPFFQPISPSYLARRQVVELAPATVVRAVGLGAYAMALSVVQLRLFRVWTSPHAALLEIPLGIAITYTTFGRTIFTAASLFRLMGFDISSGMNRPFLARSFAEFFGRFNHYVRDAVLSLFFIPLFVRLRRTLRPRAAAITAAYVAIVVGSFVLNQLLVPVSTSLHWQAALRQNLRPVTVLTMVLFWTAIILPSAHFEPTARKPGQDSKSHSRVLPVARFLLAYVGLWAAMWALENWHRVLP